MKKLTALSLIFLLLTLSACRTIPSDLKTDSSYDITYITSEIEISYADESSDVDSSDSSKSDKNSILPEEITPTADDTQSEITVSVPEDEVVVPVERTDETVNPVTPPVLEPEKAITELPDFEEKTFSELDIETQSFEHTAVSKEDYYQYSQMSAAEKQVYSLLQSAVLSCKNRVDISKIGLNTDAATLAVYRFRADYPQYFWLSHSFAFTYNSMNDTVSSIYLLYTDGTSVDCLKQTGGNNLQVSIMADRYKIAQRQKEVNAAIESIISEIDANWSDYRKEKYIHDYVAANMVYDFDAAEDPYISENILKPAFDIYSALINKSGVCEAYSKMFQVLCYAVGINANQVTGVGHMWNVVLIDGEWYQVDVTWDDSDTSGSMHSGIRYNYFNLSSNQIAKDGYHTPDGTLYIPDCSSNKYSLQFAWQ